jgi:O-acetylhomoserine/O-acetylserine sulfhydrylase-like pyridoxal-dependent enzyme
MNPFPRVSATRQGAIATNGKAGGKDARAVLANEVRPGSVTAEVSDQKAGAVQPASGTSPGLAAKAVAEMQTNIATKDLLYI